MSWLKQNSSNLMGWFLRILVGAVALSFVGFLVWYMLWVSFVEQHEFGYTYNKMTGQIDTLEHNGWVVRTPWVYDVHAIDMRPYQVAISANQRILNAKLVRFNPAGLRTFIAWHGRTAGNSTENLKEILKCYAFDRDEGRDCPFLTVTSVLAPSQNAAYPTDSLGRGGK